MKKTKQKNTEIFPPMSTYNYSYTTTQNKKNQFQKNVQMMKPVSSERDNKKDKFWAFAGSLKKFANPRNPISKIK